MRTTAILNLKGGVAKTVTCVNMAAILAADQGKRVLVVDADSQANTTEFFGGVDACASTMSNLLRGMEACTVIHNTGTARISLIAADDSLMDLDLSSVKSKEADMGSLNRLLSAHRDEYDYCLIDCPPAFNAAAAAALLAADDVIIPIKLDAFSLRGMANLTRQIRNMQEINPSLQIAGLLPTMVYRSEKIMKAMRILRLSDFNIYHPIRRTTKVDDMTFVQKPLIESSPRSAACVDYRRFVKAYIREGGAIRG